MSDGTDAVAAPQEAARDRLARLLLDRQDRREQQALEIRPVDRGRPVRLSFAQERLWFLSHLEKGSQTYHIPFGLRFRGGLDERALRWSLDRLVARHEPLRTTILEEGGSVYQVIGPADRGFDLRTHDLSSSPDALAGLLEAAAGEPFDLGRGPLARGILARLGPDEHVLQVTLHHIIADGWSLGVFGRELAMLYRARVEGSDDPLKPLDLQYADFAGWQREWLSGEELTRQKAFWFSRLSGAPQMLALPTDRPRPPVQDFRAGFVTLALDGGLARRLKALCRLRGVTLFMAVLAGWAVVLSRLSNQGEVVVGAPVANRMRADTEGLIGLFVNSLALRVDVSGAPTFGELLDRVRRLTLEAQEHQDLPFEQVVEAVRPPRSLSHPPIFQTMFVWQSTETSALDLPGLDVSRAGGARGATQFDLTLNLGEADGRIVGGLEYATALFDAATVTRFGGYLVEVLTQMTAEPASPVVGTGMLSDAERTQVLEAWNATEAAYPRQACIHGLFEAQVAKDGSAVAVAHGGLSLTYDELNARANRLARHLRDLGVGPGTLVALCVERSLEMVVALLAVLKAGGAYVPLDPAYPAERLAFMLGDAAPAAVLTHGAAAPALQAALALSTASAPVLDLERDAALWAERGAADLGPGGATSGDLAYVIYTSGSTGQPKGVMVEHRNLVASTLARPAAYGSGQVRPILLSSISFDSSKASIYWPLLTGGRVILFRSDVGSAVADISEAVRTDGATLLLCTPSLYRSLLEMVDPETPSLDTVIVAGEPCAPDLVELHRQRRPRVRLVNEYGPTECTVWATYHACGHEAADAVVPIGRPIANTRIYLLDGGLQPVPVGVAGELYIGGAGVARGYLNRPELTAERFIASPFVAGDRLYRTGDLARWRPDGEIEFLGRNDHQVKLRGFRIELGEIEARLLAHPAVREAVVLAREDAAGDKRLVAYYTATAEAEGLRAHLAASLPEHMVPAAYVRLEALPLTPNGKLDRKALPAPDATSYAQRTYEAPRGPVEEALAAIWSEVLGLEQVGRNDNFFELGGHSLLAIKVLERMRQAGLEADVRALFMTPVLADLAAGAAPAGPDVAIPPNLIPADCAAITPQMLPLVSLTQAEIDTIVAGVPGGARNLQDIYPLAPLQEGILFHHLMGKEGDPYLTWSLLQFADRDALDAAVTALNAVVLRHDILRSSVVWEGLREPVQVVWRKAVLSLETLELDPSQEVGAQLQARFDPRRERLDVGRAPMMRLVAAPHPGSGRWTALWLHHHLVMDHATIEALTAEVEAHLSGRAGDLPEPQAFRDFVARTRLANSPEAHEAFFSAMLGDVDTSTAPFGMSGVQGDGGAIQEARAGVDAGLAQRARARARDLGVTPASLFHVAWALVVGRASGQTAPVFGTVLVGRTQAGGDAERGLGMFMNTLPIKVRLGEVAAEACVLETHRLLSELLAHEQASLALAQRCSAVVAAPLFSSLLNYRHARRAAASSAGAPYRLRLEAAGERTNYPLSLNVDDTGDGFSLQVQSSDVIGPDRVCAMVLQALDSLVTALEVEPARAVGTVETLSDAERTQVLEAWNATEAAYPRQACIHGLFEAQVAKDGSAVAVAHGGLSLTYDELNARANRLARHLRDLGVGPGTLVALCVERSLEMVVALLAVLKAGGAYVPLDPAYPAERLAFMLGDAAPAAVLTHGAAAPALQAALALSTASAPVLDLERDAALWAERGAADLGPGGATSGDLAYVIYTSGSTGQPKGVMVEHRCVVNLLSGLSEKLGFGAQSAFLALTTVAFDIAGLELWLPLSRGARVVLADGLRDAGAADIVRRMTEDRELLVQATPVVWKALLDAGARGDGDRPVLCGGEAMPAGLHAAFHCAGLKPLNLYGPTETTIWSTFFQGEPDGVAPPIGRPIANTRIYLLDGGLQPVPVGVAGELYIGGAGVARGYLNRPELTAERFIASPFVAGDRLYRTGDLARWRPDGEIEFLGRNDHQVKLRGFRIELGEIEARLLAHPAVREAVVLAREDAAGDKRLVAYYTATAEAEGLRAHLAASLPEHMVPAAYVRLEALPLTPNGKLDRKALPAPDATSYAQRTYEAPRGPMEEALAAIWSEVLGLEQVGRNDDFFELGGHSLLAVRIVSRVRTALELEVGVKDLFVQPTLGAFAAMLSTQRSAVERLQAEDSARIERSVEGMSDDEVANMLLLLASEGGN